MNRILRARAAAYVLAPACLLAACANSPLRSMGEDDSAQRLLERIDGVTHAIVKVYEEDDSYFLSEVLVSFSPDADAETLAAAMAEVADVLRDADLPENDEFTATVSDSDEAIVILSDGDETDEPYARFSVETEDATFDRVAEHWLYLADAYADVFRGDWGAAMTINQYEGMREEVSLTFPEGRVGEQCEDFAALARRVAEDPVLVDWPVTWDLTQRAAAPDDHPESDDNVSGMCTIEGPVTPEVVDAYDALRTSRAPDPGVGRAEFPVKVSLWHDGHWKAHALAAWAPPSTLEQFTAKRFGDEFAPALREFRDEAAALGDDTEVSFGIVHHVPFEDYWTYDNFYDSAERDSGGWRELLEP